MRISDWSSERLLFRSGQYSWLADQLLFKTGNSDDQVKVTQGENGQLRFDVNGAEYDVALARGQQLTVRTGDGNDNIEIDPAVKVNFIIEAGDGAATIQGGAGTDRLDRRRGKHAIDTRTDVNYALAGPGDPSHPPR